jgi:hypothetical protein
MRLILSGVPGMWVLLPLLMVTGALCLGVLDWAKRYINRKRCRAHNARYYAKRPHLSPVTPAATGGPSSKKKPVARNTHAKH